MNKIKILKKDLILLPILLVSFYIISLFLLKNYIYGDQEHYHLFYEAIKVEKISNIMVLAYEYITSSDPVSVLILWFGSSLGFEKNTYISILNIILILGLFLMVRQYHVHGFMICLLLSNFYIFVLMTGAERLKIAYIFLVLSVIFTGKKRFIMMIMAPLAHFQSFILLFGALVASLETQIKKLIFNFKISKNYFNLSIMFFTLFSLMLVLFHNALFNKILIYLSREYFLTDFINIGILCIIALYVSHRRIRMLLALFPMTLFVALLGGDRVNMIAFSLVFFLLMVERRLHHPLIYILMMYFSIKTIPFLINIINYGHGFPADY